MQTRAESNDDKLGWTMRMIRAAEELRMDAMRRCVDASTPRRMTGYPIRNVPHLYHAPIWSKWRLPFGWLRKNGGLKNPLSNFGPSGYSSQSQPRLATYINAHQIMANQKSNAPMAVWPHEPINGQTAVQPNGITAE